MVDFLKNRQTLTNEFYGVWQKVATHYRTQYLNAEV